MPELADSEKAIFRVALSLTDPSERSKFLQQSCGNDALMLQQLERLLAADDAADRFLSSPAGSSDLADSNNIFDVPSERIGKYKLLQILGEGGFGVVYMAEQQEPVVRKVALKVIKMGMDTKQVVARFDAERQALARMDHPHIAKVLDGGATETGRPFFVMELVCGTSVMEYCDQRQLTNPQRLSLFLDICGAIQHAHQKGIVHRDLKPTNILVTVHDGRPAPKVIDFGIAKATQGRLTEKTLFTRLEQFIGTPAYMSPEQAEMGGLDIDTRSDIYSLGVLLYELLTGQTPFDQEELSNIGYDTICRRIREQEPPKPSTRLSSLRHTVLSKIAQNRRSDSASLPSLLRGDLDWIVMKALEKDRERRYETASALAEDIQRYLRQEPVLAVPPSKMYRFQKFARRNRAAISLAATVTAILILATMVSLWQAVRAVKAEQEQGRLLVVAEKEAKRAEAGELRARKTAYGSDMVAADYALKLSNLGRARRLLNRNYPAPGETDLRNWEWRALWQRCRGDAISTFGDSGYQICSTSLSPDGKWLATGEFGGEIRAWDIQRGKTVAILSPRIPSESRYGQVVFASQGNRLFATAGGGLVKAWEASSWSKADLQFSHGFRIRSISLSHDGTLLAIVGFDEMISLWDVERQTELGRINGSLGSGTARVAIAISPNNQWLAIGLGDGSIRMVDLTTFEEQFHFPTTVQDERVLTLAFSPNGKILASGTGFADAAVDLWNVSKRTLVDRLEGHTHYIRSLAFSPDGTQLASASADQTIRLWDTGTWKDPTVLRGHQQEVWSLAFTSDGGRLVSGSKDGAICIWSTKRRAKTPWPISLPGELLHAHYELSSPEGRASFSPDGQWLATRNKDGTVSLRSADSLKETHRLKELGTNNTGLLFAPRGRFIVVGDNAGILTWIDPLQPQEKRQQRLSPPARLFPVNFSSDGKQLLVLARGDQQTRCIIYSVESSKELHSWTVPSNRTCTAFSPDGRLVVTGHSDGTVRFWEVADPRKPAIVDHRGRVGGVTFSPDGSLLAVGTWYGEARIYDTATRSQVGILRGHTTGIHAVQFSPDGKRLATGGSAGESVKLWDLAIRQEVATLIAPGYSFEKIQFSPDGNAILAISYQDSLSLWRVPSWGKIRTAGD